MFSFVSCTANEYVDCIITDPVRQSTFDTAQSVISSVTEPEPIPVSDECDKTDEENTPTQDTIQSEEHSPHEEVPDTSQPKPKCYSDYISALDEYDLRCSAYRESDFDSPEDKLRTFIKDCSPLNIVGNNDLLVMAYYSGVSSRDCIIPEAELRNISPDDLFARDADISVYYRDLTTGEEFSYNENEVRDSASLSKLPYLLSVLEEISHFEGSFEGEIVYSDENKKYDLNEKWTYNSAEMFRYGSGVIFEMEDGVEFTYEELFSFAFRNSDNIAYSQIKQRFGREAYYSLLSRLGIEPPSPDERFLTARELGIVLCEAYDFMENGGRLGEFLKNEMLAAKLSNIIGMSYPPDTVAHKYGWDVCAYHDMGIVLENHPYAVVIMTDYDTGGTAVDRYFADIIKLIKEIHKETE